MAQLAKSAGDKSIYDIIRKSDETATPPGANDLRELFSRAGGSVCVIMDELVKYAGSLPLSDKKTDSGTSGVRGVPDLIESFKRSCNR